MVAALLSTDQAALPNSPANFPPDCSISYINHYVGDFKLVSDISQPGLFTEIGKIGRVHLKTL